MLYLSDAQAWQQLVDQAKKERVSVSLLAGDLLTKQLRPKESQREKTIQV